MATRVVCVGNELACDDGIGIRVGRVLLSLPLPGEVTVDLRGLAGLDLLDAVADVGLLVLVDAMTSGCAAGTCLVRGLADFGVRTQSPFLRHGVGLVEVLELARRLIPERFPERVALVGVEAAVLARFGTTLSEHVRAALPETVEAVLRLVGASEELVAAGRAEAERRRSWEPTLTEAVAG